MKQEFRQRPNDAGFTLIEVLVCLIILVLMGYVIWSNFATGMDVLLKVPRVGEYITDLLNLENTFRYYLRFVEFPLWVTEYEFSNDDEEVILPYYYGYKDYKLSIYVEIDEDTFKDLLVIEGNLDNIERDLPVNPALSNFKHIFGPFEKIRLSEVQNEEDEGLMGIELTVLPLNEDDGEVTIFAKIGRIPFWKE